MQSQEIMLQVPPEIARAFLAASEEERKLAIRVFVDFIKPRGGADAIREFTEARRRMSEEATASGLTQATLDDILSDES